MDRGRPSSGSRSGIASRADRSSGRGFVASIPAPPGGSTQTQKHRNLANLGSDYRSRTTGIPVPADAMLSSKWSRSFKERAPGTPIKKLLAEEMFNESKSKRSQPGLVARLMGLDGLPVQQPSTKQRTSQHSTALIESHRNAISYDSYRHRNTSKEHKEFKDVFEVTETPRVQSGRVPLQRTESARIGEGRSESFRQKFIDAKHLSSDRRLQHSRGFHNTLEVLDSNTDCSMKFRPETNSMYTNDLQNLKENPSQSHYSHSAVTSSANALKHARKVQLSIQGRHTTWKGDNSSSPKHLGDQSSSRHDVHSSLNSKVQRDGDDELQKLPTRIVVLKPNIGKSRKAAKSFFPPHPSHAFLSGSEKSVEFSGIRHREGQLWEKENLFDDMGFSRSKSRESREIAKEITRQVRNGLSGGSINLSPSFRRGYAGDESPFSMSEDDCANESDATTLTSRYSFDCDIPFEPSSSHSTEWSAKGYTKNRLSKRWKTNQNFLYVGTNDNGSGTLGEMLSISDREALKRNLGVVIAQDDWSGNGGIAGKDGPFGISSRDGWRNEGIGNLSRSRSFPTSPAAFGRSKAITGRESMGDDRKMMSKEIINKGRNKEVEVNYDQQEGSSCRNSRSGNKKIRAPHHSFRESNGNLLHSYYSQNQVHSDFEDKVTSERKPLGPARPASTVRDAGSVPNDVLDKTTHENMNMPSKFSDSLINETSDSLVVKAMPSGGVNDIVSQEPESPTSLMDTDQPSPISVLEVPCVEDPSSGCECFERISADLQGLRMQLQLLKLESESYEEGPMLMSSDEDVGDYEEKAIARAPESWRYSYLVDVLNQCDFDDTDSDMFMASWYSSDSPISPLVFENLENKYCDQSSCLWSERRLLFDCINLGIIEIFELFMDQRPWVKSVPVKVLPKQGKVDLEHELWKLVERQEKKRFVDGEEMLGKEWQWMNLGADFDVIGKEVERLLIEQLVLEVFVA